MPIRVIVRNGDRKVPIIVCEHCVNEIERAADGDVHWRAIDISEPLFTHKGCSAEYRRGLPHVHLSTELSEFLERLAT